MMRTPLYKRYENAQPVGVYPMSNYGGLAVLDIQEADEIAVAAFHWGDGYQQIRRHRIQYSSSGRAYIRKQGTRFYFDQILRAGGDRA